MQDWNKEDIYILAVKRKIEQSEFACKRESISVI